MLKGYDMMLAVGRYSILLSLTAPIYIFASGEYHDGGKLAVAILTFVVILTTYMYWTKKDLTRQGFWRYFDRAVAASLVIIPFVLADGEKRWDIRTFLLLSIYFYLLGWSSSYWKDHNGHLNHAAFRYFGALGIILYIVKESDKVYQDVFVGLATLGLIISSYLVIKDYRQSNKIDSLKKNSIIF